VFPHEARIRNLTYATEIYVDVRLQKLQLEPPEKGGLKDGEKKEPKFTVLEDYPTKQAFLGKVPVMVRSKFCHLKNLEDHEIIRNAKECTFD
jgi:DNA-directed RNA polymerase II subunit RPB2